ncbi:MAG: hypothetical protein NTZ68_03955 [Candidatus Dependentiae bacterium]|nr:hypothetical protein [Candidatus Dependentiae bacterium]
MFYIFLSVFLFLIPFFIPALSIPCSFVFLIPLILKSQKAPLTFFDGFAWGMMAFGVHGVWFLAMIATKPVGASAIVLWIGTIGWLSLFSGLWLKLVRFSWLRSTVLFFFFIINFCMFPLGALDGYPFFSPLIPLCYYPQFLWCLKYIGSIGALSCLILFQTSLAQTRLAQTSLIQKKILRSALCLTPFLIGPFFYQEKVIPTPHMQYIKPWWYGHHNPMFAGYRMVHDIGEVIMARPQTVCILMPESTFCWDVLDYQNFVPLWSDPDCQATIMFGGHRCVSGETFNSFIVLRGGKITYCYDKQHLMPFIERIPKVCSFFGCGEIFIEAGSACGCSVDSHDTIDICGQTYQVFICSELFFEAKPVKGYPIILICNESWFCCQYMKDLAVLYIKYFEIKHDVKVLYASTQGRTNVGKVNVV